MKEQKLKGLFGRTGGKSKLKDKIRRMMPPHTTYIEPFVGGGSVFFSAPADPNRKEIINDKDRDIINIYLDVKNVGDKVIDLPVVKSKEQFNALVNKKKFASPVERLKRNILVGLYSFRSDRKSYAPSKTVEKLGRGSVGSQKKYYKYKERLKNTRILSQDYRTVIKKYDNPNALIYLDPPYSTALKNKDYNSNDVPIEDVINLLKTVKGKFILSYDDIPLARKLARDAGFKVMTVRTEYNAGRTGDAVSNTIPKKELIIRNY
tara:strand:- start:1310 stop:2098 length:789 start_codon:yes stop_codon:yes gene_type:complete